MVGGHSYDRFVIFTIVLLSAQQFLRTGTGAFTASQKVYLCLELDIPIHGDIFTLAVGVTAELEVAAEGVLATEVTATARGIAGMGQCCHGLDTISTEPHTHTPVT